MAEDIVNIYGIVEEFYQKFIMNLLKIQNYRNSQIIIMPMVLKLDLMFKWEMEVVKKFILLGFRNIIMTDFHAQLIYSMNIDHSISKISKLIDLIVDVGASTHFKKSETISDTKNPSNDTYKIFLLNDVSEEHIGMFRDNIIKPTISNELFDTLDFDSYNIISFDSESKTMGVVIREMSEDVLFHIYNIKRASLPNIKFHESSFITYEINVSDKIYLVNLFASKLLNGLPPGISTAYLNIHGNFECAEYMGTSLRENHRDKYYFVSVEQKLDMHFRTDNMSLFINNEKQISYFILDLLYILETLNKFKIKMDCIFDMQKKHGMEISSR